MGNSGGRQGRCISRSGAAWVGDVINVHLGSLGAVFPGGDVAGSAVDEVAGIGIVTVVVSLVSWEADELTILAVSHVTWVVVKVAGRSNSHEGQTGEELEHDEKCV